MSRYFCRPRPSAALRNRIRTNGGLTLIELIFVSAVISLLAAIAVPTVFRSRMAANETSAFGGIRTIHTAQLTYALTCGQGNYASAFPDLANGGTDPFLPPDLTSSPTPFKSGYNYALQPGPVGQSGAADCNGNVTSFDYYVSTAPVAIGETGRRAFASNQAHVIWQDILGVAPVEPFTALGTVSPMEAN
jgi:prepilin-type N-terminal cleavage/methylation domain-containing protein